MNKFSRITSSYLNCDAICCACTIIMVTSRLCIHPICSCYHILIHQRATIFTTSDHCCLYNFHTIYLVVNNSTCMFCCQCITYDKWNYFHTKLLDNNISVYNLISAVPVTLKPKQRHITHKMQTHNMLNTILIGRTLPSRVLPAPTLVKIIGI